MDEKQKITDEEKGKISPHGRNMSWPKNEDTEDYAASPSSATIYASPVLSGEKRGIPSSKESSSTEYLQKRTLLQRFIALWRPKCNEEVSERKTMVQEVHNTPIGYPRLAAFLASDDNFMHYRSFGYLHSRVLLEKQDDLRQLEEELARIDEQGVQLRPDLLMTRDLINVDKMMNPGRAAADIDINTIDGNLTRRKKVLQLISSNLKEYGKMLTTAQAVIAMNKPTAGEKFSVRNWIEYVYPVFDADASFVEHTEDLVTLRPGRDHAWLDAGIEKVLQGCKIAFIRNLFISKTTQRKKGDTGIEVYFTRRRIERLVIMIITIMILALLIVPIWLLYHITAGIQTARSNATCIGILLVFTLAFSACISLFTRAKRHEILAAAAGYCAVLVVFLGNVNGGFGGPRDLSESTPSFRVHQIYSQRTGNYEDMQVISFGSTSEVQLIYSQSLYRDTEGNAE